MKNVDFLNDLAIRASYGIQGNVHPDQTPNLIASLGTLESMPQEYISTLYKLPNNKLKWEKTNSYNIAIDWAFWNNRIYGSLDVYYKKGVDQVVTKNVAPSTVRQVSPLMMVMLRIKVGFGCFFCSDSDPGLDVEFIIQYR